MLYLLGERFFDSSVDSINFGYNVNTFSLWLFYKDIED